MSGLKSEIPAALCNGLPDDDQLVRLGVWFTVGVLVYCRSVNWSTVGVLVYCRSVNWSTVQVLIGLL